MTTGLRASGSASVDQKKLDRGFGSKAVVITHDGLRLLSGVRPTSNVQRMRGDASSKRINTVIVLAGVSTRSATVKLLALNAERT
jgi:hypothetical protein